MVLISRYFEPYSQHYNKSLQSKYIEMNVEVVFIFMVKFGYGDNEYLTVVWIQ